MFGSFENEAPGIGIMCDLVAAISAAWMEKMGGHRSDLGVHRNSGIVL